MLLMPVRMFTFTPVDGCNYKQDYSEICYSLNKTYEDKNWEEACKIIRKNVLDDMFFFIYFVGGVKEINHPFTVERILNYENNTTRTLDLWFRNGYKSTIISVYGVIQECLRDTIMAGIFSHTGSIAKTFLRRIKIILETNGLLRSAFYDKIPENPQTTKGLTWDIDKSLQLIDGKRYGSSIMASGLVDSMPTGIHLDYIVYDDICVKESVSTAEQREKLREAYSLSHGIHTKKCRYRIVGTRYHYADLYGDLISSGEYNVSICPITHNGDFPFKPETAQDEFAAMGNGVAIFYDQEYVWRRFKEMGKDVFSTQMLLNPTKADERTFNIDWLKYYDKAPTTRNYIIVDPASAAKKESSYTVMWTIGVSRGYYYIKDCIRDRISLTEKKEKLFSLVDKWNAVKVYYEKYSMQADIEYLLEKQKEEGFYFPIVPVGGVKLTKDERILLLQPLFQEGRIILPKNIMYIDTKGKRRNLVEEFIKDEYLDFPLCATKDMLDALARICDKDVKMYHVFKKEPEVAEKTINPLALDNGSQYNWMDM